MTYTAVRANQNSPNRVQLVFIHLCLFISNDYVVALHTNWRVVFRVALALCLFCFQRHNPDVFDVYVFLSFAWYLINKYCIFRRISIYLSFSLALCWLCTIFYGRIVGREKKVQLCEHNRIEEMTLILFSFVRSQICRRRNIHCSAIRMLSVNDDNIDAYMQISRQQIVRVCVWCVSCVQFTQC